MIQRQIVYDRNNKLKNMDKEDIMIFGKKKKLDHKDVYIKP